MKIEHKNMAVELKSGLICVWIQDKYYYEHDVTGIAITQLAISHAVYAAIELYTKSLLDIRLEASRELGKMVLEANKPKIDQSV